MKKVVLSLILFMTMALTVNAQFGARAGVNLANLSFSEGDDSESFDNSLGFHVGLTYEAMVSEKLSFRPGLLYSVKGAKQSFDFLGETIETKIKINYIEIPLDFSYAAGALDINAGPYIGYGLSAKATSEAGGVKESEDIEFENGGLKRIDFGINLGLAYNFNTALSLGAQYGLGLSNIADPVDGDETTTKNKVIGIFLGYNF